MPLHGSILARCCSLETILPRRTLPKPIEVSLAENSCVLRRCAEVTINARTGGGTPRPDRRFVYRTRSHPRRRRQFRTTIIVRSCMPSSAFSSAGAQGLPSREVAPRRARSIKSRRLTRAAQWSAPTDCRSSTTPPCGGLPINRKKARHQGSENT